MGVVFRLAEFWWLIVPLAGVIVAAHRALTADRRRATAPMPERDAAARRREINRVVEEHNRTDTRWLDYEMNPAKLLDFPVMTDMRDPLTVGFHRAKLRADMLRPLDVGDLVSDRDAQADYREAVQDYVTAFDVAEAEAIRRRRSDFSAEGQQRLARAQSLLRLASDHAATPGERQRAYDRACRELDGLLVLPTTTRASIERRIVGQLET
ncbi:MAG TPA: hypothetical protein VMU34_16090 [Mycobacterium sp.]|nr:hypothetical protein [Mycobacterium sp.]